MPRAPEHRSSCMTCGTHHCTSKTTHVVGPLIQVRLPHCGPPMQCLNGVHRLGFLRRRLYCRAAAPRDARDSRPCRPLVAGVAWLQRCIHGPLGIIPCQALHCHECRLSIETLELVDHSHDGHASGFGKMRIAHIPPVPATPICGSVGKVISIRIPRRAGYPDQRYHTKCDETAARGLCAPSAANRQGACKGRYILLSSKMDYFISTVLVAHLLDQPSLEAIADHEQ
mmetsp:Transcript_11741/g.30118  ORF Transcript_11741/g.30118 Transcript_11741/m.30118 type:complete len:227 (+) Transcript_11741:590-1270(+)